MAESEFIRLLRSIAGATVQSRDLLRAIRSDIQASSVSNTMPARASGMAATLDAAGSAIAASTGGSLPIAALGPTLAESTALWREHAVALETAGSAYADLGRVTAELPPGLARLSDLGQRFGQSLAEALGDVALRGEGALDTLRDLERQLVGMLTQRLALAPLRGAFDDLFGDLFGQVGKGFGGGLLGGLTGLVGFADGGRFRVGGSGGPDSKLVPLRLSPGELVEVTPPAATRGNEPVTLNINVRISPDLGQRDGFRATGRQLAQDLARQLAPVLQTL